MFYEKNKDININEILKSNGINFNTYSFYKKEGVSLIYEKEIFKDFPIIVSKRKFSTERSKPPKKFPLDKARLQISNSYNSNRKKLLKKDESDNDNDDDESEDSTDITERLNTFTNYYLLHKIPFDTKNDKFISILVKDIMKLFQNRHRSIAKVIAFELHDQDSKDCLCTLSERPINGQLSSYFKKIKLDSSDEDAFECFNENCEELTNIEKFIIILGIVAGTEFLHYLGFVHSRLQPKNIYLDRNLHSIICNVGLMHPSKEDDPNEEEGEEDNIENESEIYKHLTEDLNDADDAVFVAPEVMKMGLLSKSCDIYSIGVLIYYIISDGFENINNEPIKDIISNNSKISEKWKKIILKCIDEDPKNRPELSELLIKLLDKDKMINLIKSIRIKSSRFESNLTKNVKFTSGQEQYINDIRYRFLFKNHNFKQSTSLIKDMIDTTDITSSNFEVIQKAIQDDTESINKLASFYLKGKNNFPQDEEFAFLLYKTNAAKKDRKSIKEIGKMYMEGIGTKKNLKEARACFGEALSLYEDDTEEVGNINNEMQTIDKMLNGTYHPVDSDNKEKCEHKKDLRITIKEVPKKTSKDDITKLFNDFSVQSIDIKTNGKNKSAIVSFNKIDDVIQIKKKSANKKNFILKNKPLSFQFSTKIKNMKISTKNNLNNQIDFNDFILNNKSIDHGFFSEVFLITRKEDNKKFAAKIFKNECKNPLDKKKIWREVNSMFALNHPTIIKIIGCKMCSMRDPNYMSPTIIMEYAENGNLAEMIYSSRPNKNWNSTSKIKAAMGIAYAMMLIHQKNIIHRDLKPHNILLDKNYEIKIGDFGCSRTIEHFDEIQMTKRIGTPFYAAPEMIDAKQTCYNRKVDVYSYAIVLLEIFTGKKIKSLFPKNKNNYQIFDFVIKGGRPENNDIIDKNLKLLIELCWSQRIDDRPEFSQIFEFFKMALDHENDEKPFFDDINYDEINDYIYRLEEGIYI